METLPTPTSSLPGSLVPHTCVSTKPGLKELMLHGERSTTTIAQNCEPCVHYLSGEEITEWKGCQEWIESQGSIFEQWIYNVGLSSFKSQTCNCSLELSPLPVQWKAVMGIMKMGLLYLDKTKQYYKVLAFGANEECFLVFSYPSLLIAPSNFRFFFYSILQHSC